MRAGRFCRKLVDAYAGDEQDLEGEFVELANRGDCPLDLSGRTLRDESTRNHYSFRSGFALDPGRRVTITTGTGRLGLGTGTPVWNNSGDTAFLIDPHGRLVTIRRGRRWNGLAG